LTAYPFTNERANEHTTGDHRFIERILFAGTT
jgi:hypothetical protein